MTDAELTRFAALEIRLAALATEVDELRAGRASTMAQTHRCPACGGTHLIHFRHIKEASAGQAVIDLSLQTTSSFWSGYKAGASLEAYACRNCKLVEWHARTLADVVIDGVEVVDIVDSPRDAPSPYR